MRIKVQDVNRLVCSVRHIYAQVIAASGSQVLVSASTLDKEVRGKIKNSGNKEAAGLVGQVIAERALKAGITTVAFDRSGFRVPWPGEGAGRCRQRTRYEILTGEEIKPAWR